MHMESWRNTYRGLVPDSFLDSLDYGKRVERWQQRFTDASMEEFVYVAQDSAGRIVGFASGGPERTGHPIYKGELRALHIALDYQRHGIGHRLMSTVVARLAEMGMHSLLVWVLTGNPARAFYEGLGGIYVTERVEDLAGVPVDEVAYGWEDTTPLLTSNEQP
jgi:GNAT superfamily N-acetyltransferase